MNIQTPFITPVAIFDVSKHLPMLRNIFKDVKQKNNFVFNKPEFGTTLKNYVMDRAENCLPQGTETEELTQDIEAAAIQLAEFMGYATDRYQPAVKNFWLNEMVSGTPHEPHSHYGVHFSGCIYVDMPDNSGSIIFSSHRERYDYQPMSSAQNTIFNSGTWAFAPEEGQLFLWESWIRHSVPTTTFKGVRRTAALDVFMGLKT